MKKYDLTYTKKDKLEKLQLIKNILGGEWEYHPLGGWDDKWICSNGDIIRIDENIENYQYYSPFDYRNTFDFNIWKISFEEFLNIVKTLQEKIKELGI